jgi:hypothetical protein
VRPPGDRRRAHPHVGQDRAIMARRENQPIPAVCLGLRRSLAAWRRMRGLRGEQVAAHEPLCPSASAVALVARTRARRRSSAVTCFHLVTGTALPHRREAGDSARSLRASACRPMRAPGGHRRGRPHPARQREWCPLRGQSRAPPVRAHLAVVRRGRGPPARRPSSFRRRTEVTWRRVRACGAHRFSRPRRPGAGGRARPRRSRPTPSRTSRSR